MIAFMKHAPLQLRVRNLGLKQVELASMVGVTPANMSLQLNGKKPLSRYVEAFLMAWEELTPDQREALRRRFQEIDYLGQGNGRLREGTEAGVTGEGRD